MKNLPLSAILLPTKDASVLYINPRKELCIGQNVVMYNKQYINQYLYLCSTLPIKEGDWAFDVVNNKVLKYKKGESPIITSLLKIEFTTDPKLQEGISFQGNGSVTFGNKVSAIDGNTNAFYKYRFDANNLEEHRTTIKTQEVNLLEEFCKRYNQKDNQRGVDVEKLAEEYADFNYAKREPYIGDNLISKHSFKDGYNQAVQSNARGLDEISRWVDFQLSVFPTGDYLGAMKDIKAKIKSLTKEQPTGGIVIECEIEYKTAKEIKESKEITCEADQLKIKLNKDGQPILTLK